VSDVAAIVADVRARGDEALRAWAMKLDGVEPRRAGLAGEIPEEALLEAAANVRRWHELQRPQTVRAEIVPGVELERRWVPLASVGVYVPRSLLSSLVMAAVPAQAAGVERIVVVTPPQGAGAIARAAALLGIDEVWALGGPHAIAALAYGTETIPRVDKIVGPGNAYVNEAKLLVSRHVAIDLPAGPSEVLVIAGPDADDRVIELELAAQQEHGPESPCRALRIDGDLDAALAGASATPARSSSAATRPSPRATTRPGATTCSRPAVGRARSAGSGSRRS
jgi:histidinol dehydrogenase